VLEIQGQLGYSQRVVLQDVSLRVQAGEIVSVAGVNGAGKSTLLRTAAGMLRPRSGYARVAGISAEDSRCRRITGYVPDVAPLYEELTPWEHIDLVVRLWRPLDVTPRAEELTEHFGLEGFLHQPAHSLSLGQRKRLTLALMLVHSPRLLLLDEPFNGLDRRGSQLLQELLLRHRDAGGVVICATHVLDFLDTIASRLVVLAHGAVAIDQPNVARLTELYDRVTA